MNDDRADRVGEVFATLTKLLITMRMATLVMAVYAIIQGFLIIIGESGRFSAAGYDVAETVPGSPDIWGATILIAGILAFYGMKLRSYLVAEMGLLIGGLWSLLFAASFLFSALQDPEANLTAIAAYGKDAVIFLLMALATRDLAFQQDRDRDTHDSSADQKRKEDRGGAQADLS